MTKKWFALLASAGTALLFSAAVMASEGGSLMSAGNDLGDRASLQRGAQAYMSYCSGCHSLKYLRYSRMASDLGLSEDQVMENLNFTGAKVGEQIQVALSPEQAGKWFGKMPPDLSLIARVRGGPDWIYTYLKSFYLDESRPLGWNNKLFPNASMPNPLWELQGLQHAEFGEPDAAGDRHPERLVVTSQGRLTPEEFDQTVRDISNFLEYASEPVVLKRESMGKWVVLFLALLAFLAYLLKNEYWRDVH